MSSVASCIGIKYGYVNGAASRGRQGAGTVKVRRMAFIPCIAH